MTRANASLPLAPVGTALLMLALAGGAFTQSARAQANDASRTAQQAPPGPAIDQEPRPEIPRPEPLRPVVSFAMAFEKVVKGAPYSARSVSEFHQTLVDGNHIDRQRTTLLYRDSEGRTRQEVDGPRPLIFLNDAPAARRYVLDPVHKTAMLLTPPSASGEGASGAGSPAGPPASFGSRLHSAWDRVTHFVGITPGNADGRVEGRDGPPPHAEIGAGPPDRRPDFGEHPGPPSDLGGATPGEMPAPGPFVFREPRGPGIVTPLGGRDVEGIHADGSRTTWTIPAGQVGNERAITLTSEQWIAPDLRVVMYARDFDPRDGETVYQIKDVKRGEPAAELFRVPPDYQVTTPPRLPSRHGPG